MILQNIAYPYIPMYDMPWSYDRFRVCISPLILILHVLRYLFHSETTKNNWNNKDNKLWTLENMWTRENMWTLENVNTWEQDVWWNSIFHWNPWYLHLGDVRIWDLANQLEAPEWSRNCRNYGQPIRRAKIHIIIILFKKIIFLVKKFCSETIFAQNHDIW